MALFSKDPQPPPLRTDPQSPAPRGSVVGPNLAFDGTLTGNEPLTIEGAVRGKINLESDLRVGPSARVEATVHAKNVLIEGVVVGDVSADSRIELISTAKVDGNLKAPKIVVSEGAKFRGAVDMGSDRPEDRTRATESKEKTHAGNRDQKGN